MIKMNTMFIAVPTEVEKEKFARLIVEYDNVLLEFFNDTGRLPIDLPEAIKWLEKFNENNM